MRRVGCGRDRTWRCWWQPQPHGSIAAGCRRPAWFCVGRLYRRARQSRAGSLLSLPKGSMRRCRVHGRVRKRARAEAAVERTPRRRRRGRRSERAPPRRSIANLVLGCNSRTARRPRPPFGVPHPVGTSRPRLRCCKLRRKLQQARVARAPAPRPTSHACSASSRMTRAQKSRLVAMLRGEVAGCPSPS